MKVSEEIEDRVQQRKIQHLYLRAAWGETPQFLKANAAQPLQWHVDRLFRDAEKINDLTAIADPTKGHEKEVGRFKMGVLFERSKKDLKELNLHWLDQMADSKAPLQEKITLFWHDHFATNVPVGYLMQVQNNTLRRLALGKFGDLLHAVAKDPAMLIYLNNQQNKKGHPNENFAREVMELFTLGIGNYAETDIKEAARAFTGWQVNAIGQYEFNSRQHDKDHKTVLGKSGNLTGEQVLDILLAHPQTAKHLARKLYAWFVNPIPDLTSITAIENWLLQSQLDIGKTLRNIFLADWFYADQHFGALVKSPVELLIQYKRLLKMKLPHTNFMLKVQSALGQMLFFPPNVAGWPNGTQWIDSSTLVLRMKLPLVLFGADEFEIAVKIDLDDEGPDISETNIPKMMKANVEWKEFTAAFAELSEQEIPQALVDALIVAPQQRIDLVNLLKFADPGSKIEMIKSLALRVMALPEFQLK
jgi:uncharacterized protein (DUF1800 family)